jgi:hypothetical protein
LLMSHGPRRVLIPGILRFNVHQQLYVNLCIPQIPDRSSRPRTKMKIPNLKFLKDSSRRATSAKFSYVFCCACGSFLPTVLRYDAWYCLQMKRLQSGLVGVPLLMFKTDKCYSQPGTRILEESRKLHCFQTTLHMEHDGMNILWHRSSNKVVVYRLSPSVAPAPKSRLCPPLNRIGPTENRVLRVVHFVYKMIYQL